MLYYKIAVFNSPLEPLTYYSEKKIELFSVVDILLNGKEKKGVVLEETIKPDFETISVLNVTDFYYKPFQNDFAKFISNYYICSLGEAYNLITPFKKVYLKKDDVKISTDIQLSSKQQEAYEFVKKENISLLFGDTGSGKTEIYLKLFEDVINKGGRCLFLLPEISLTPQMEARLKKHFGESVVLWHSKLTKKQREKNLQALYNNNAKIIAGARSALFLPLDDIKIIVVDEEHDDSYKSSKNPRYNAKDLAVYLAKLLDIKVVLGSATPSLNSYVKFPHFRLKEAYIKTDKRFIYEKGYESLSENILNLLEDTVKKGEQAIVFVPTRANFKHLVCKDCGYNFKCEFCNVSMSLHIKQNALKCHYCGYAVKIPKRCFECSSENLATNRIGTAEVVKNLQQIFPSFNIEQFDRDTITTNAKLKKALKRFNDKETDILVGTQMLSKGHDYKDVTLAVVLGIDNLLNMPNFLARTKALSSLIQIAGRSGRKKDATVYIQTLNEEFFKRFINKFEDFLEEEKFYRQDLYPPFKKLARVLIAHKKSETAKKEMEKILQLLENFKDVEVVGFGECGINRIAGRYRFEVLLRSEKPKPLLTACRYIKSPLTQIDIDPVEFI